MSHADAEGVAGERIRRALLVGASVVLTATTAGLLIALPSVLV